MRVCLLMVLFFFMLMKTVPAQDTTQYRHAFRLPTKDNQSWYEKNITQYPNEVHHFSFEVPDSCTVYIVIRSASDSLHINLGHTKIKLKTKQDNLYTYAFSGALLKGKNVFLIRTRTYCSYKVSVKGQL
jgi:hypothetical protein